MTPKCPTCGAPDAWRDNLERAVRDIHDERARQCLVEEYDFAHDDEHDRGELAVNAARLLVYGTDAHVEHAEDEGPSDRWADWGLAAKHSGDERRRLVIAGALVVAEIERLDRASREPAASVAAAGPSEYFGHLASTGELVNPVGMLPAREPAAPAPPPTEIPPEHADLVRQALAVSNGLRKAPADVYARHLAGSLMLAVYGDDERAAQGGTIRERVVGALQRKGVLAITPEMDTLLTMLDAERAERKP